MFTFQIVSAAIVGAFVAVTVAFKKDDSTLATKEFRFTPAPTFGLVDALAEIRAELQPIARRESARLLTEALDAAIAAQTVFPLTEAATTPPTL